MGSPKESLEQKNIFTEKYDEIRRLDGIIQDTFFVYFCARLASKFARIAESTPFSSNLQYGNTVKDA